MRPRRTLFRPPAGLKDALDGLYACYNQAGQVADPVELVRPYRTAADREIAGFLAAGLAFGRVASILQSVRAVLDVLGPEPAAFLRRFDPVRDGSAFAALGHRWTRGEDLSALVALLGRMCKEAGSIEGFFLEGHDAGAADIEPSLESFSRRALAIAGDGASRRRGFAYFFPRPSAGSACKRLNLYLRWMVRADQVDPGAWTGVSRSQLVVPLDVHVIRVGRCLGLTGRLSPGWPMAAEITAALRRLDPDDPVRYDFALCHVGMRGECGLNQPWADSRCPLAGWCRPRRPSVERSGLPG